MKKIIPFHELTCVRKAKTVAIFPNAIEIVAGAKKVTIQLLVAGKQSKFTLSCCTHKVSCLLNFILQYFFASFLSRDEAYRLIIEGWVQRGGDIKPIVSNFF